MVTKSSHVRDGATEGRDYRGVGPAMTNRDNSQNKVEETFSRQRKTVKTRPKITTKSELG